MPDSLELSDSYHEAAKFDKDNLACPCPGPDAAFHEPVSHVVGEQSSPTQMLSAISGKPGNSVLTEGIPDSQIPPSNDPKLVWQRSLGGSDSSRSIHKVQQILKTRETEEPREADDPQQWPKGRKVLHSIIPSVIAFLT